MVALPQQFNTADLPDTGGNMVLIPAGQYSALIVNSEMKETRDKAGQFLALTLVITQGDYANTEFVERLNIVNKNPKAVEIAYKTLARMSEAVGMNKTPLDSTELHNKPLMIEVKTEEGKPWVDNDGVTQKGKDKSVIGKYLTTPAVGTGAPAAGVSPGAPVAAPATAAPTAAVATPPAGGNPFQS